MTNRRNFIKTAAMASVAVALQSFKGKVNIEKKTVCYWNDCFGY